MHILVVENDRYAVESLLRAIHTHVADSQVSWLTGAEPDILRQCAAVDLVLLDMGLGMRDGVDLCRQLRMEHDGSTSVLGITSNPLEFYRDRLVDAGAQGLVQKGSLRAILDAIATVSSGEAMPGFPKVDDAHRAVQEHGPSPEEQLTLQEHKIMTCLAHLGLDYTALAEALGVSEATVRSHMRNIRRKYGVASANEVLMVAVEQRFRGHHA
ncbi:response regulator transcription factor [Bifidobacterium cuniculi]|uniref:Putative two-component system response regulator n=1 Tax=Bifidobacterium cuniculi TaxID=1688 RepID=A0A087AN07_9BIFI|nr:response regulator transcription factor [Bifidobacterium cuniculi]KFI60157.1 putative two-component system response regulator [Bifidobacterium cuniculi]